VVVGAGGLAHLTPVRVTMGRLAAGARGTVTIAAVASAAIGTVPPLSWGWVAPVLIALVAWTSVYVRVAWTVGMRPWVAFVDLAFGAFLCLNIGHLVPAAAQQGTSWVGVTVSMIVVWAQVTGSPAIYVPAGLLVAGTFVMGSQMAQIENGLGFGITMATQVIAGAAVMQIAVRAGRVASRTFDELQMAERAAAIETARRADERAQLRLLHNGPLTTLTMAIHREGQRQPSPLLRQRSAVNLIELQQLASETPDGESTEDGGATRLDERLAQVVVWYEPMLQMSTRLSACVVPRSAADAFAEAASEALENVVRHAKTDRVIVVLDEATGTIRATITDRGRGFEPAGDTDQHFGIREAMVGRMAAAGGCARVESQPGQGTTVVLEWPHD
jgi:Histidine kinase-like ATPase domain